MNLSKLSEKELCQLEYEEEKKYADLIRSSSPFSDERQMITAEAYAKIAEFVDERCSRAGKTHAYGANKKYIDIIHSALNYLREHRDANRDLVFYEAGVGTGFILKGLNKEKNLQIYGCDVYLTEDIKADFPNLHESTIMQSLRLLPDHFIDVIYWNDVMEHMPVDEIDTLLRLFAKKCRPGGLMITITPSAFKGPHDITRIADPHADKAHGLHLKEYSLAEVLEKYEENGWEPIAWVKNGNVTFTNAKSYYKRRVSMEDFIHNGFISHLIPKKILRKFPFSSISVASPKKA